MSAFRNAIVFGASTGIGAELVRNLAKSGVKVAAIARRKSLLDKLEHSRFVRTHKSFLVNLTKVDTITLNYLVIGDYDIPISKNYRSDLLAGLDIV